jgi:hypothetical protein
MAGLTELPGGSAEVSGGLSADEIKQTGLYVSGDVLNGILVELRVISHILNEGMNTKENLDILRHDEEEDIGG